MCSILLSYKPAKEWIWQIAANRDEQLERPAQPPTVLAEVPRVVGGRDLLAGGTWFAIQPAAKMFAGLTNRHMRSDPDWNGEQSRGKLIPHILRAASAIEAKSRLRQLLSVETVNNFMMLFGDPHHLFYADYDSGVLNVDALEPGVYVLCNTPMTHESTPKMKLIRRLIETELTTAPLAWNDRAQRVLRHTGLPMDFGHAADLTPVDALNVRTDDYGTRSALIATCHSTQGLRYLATEGNPSDTPFKDVTQLLGEQRTHG